ncbi:hypothetical protein D9756_008866 [Leucocoprinus leucothites]|uniref:DUF6593 domain-containing protein n=1 Tax=Leucocoprinus leucothites TaxID=201217 RepID=A0A8H5CWZ2_9AGAR|nr:hypothetical protein D9756_008866 [Leucoagaricus leucothites]
MDSKLTLVNPGDPQTIQLVFSKNSTLNTSILVNGQVRYIVSTTDRQAQKTSITDAITKNVWVSVQRRTFLSDKIVFVNRGGAEQKFSNIMKNHKLDDGYTAHMMHTDLGDLYWKVHKIHRLALFSVSDPVEPVAYREQLSHPINTFALTIRKEYESLLDYIVPTFLYLEQGLRGGEKQADIADGMIAENRTLLGHYVNTSTV